MWLFNISIIYNIIRIKTYSVFNNIIYLVLIFSGTYYMVYLASFSPLGVITASIVVRWFVIVIILSVSVTILLNTCFDILDKSYLVIESALIGQLKDGLLLLLRIFQILICIIFGILKLLCSLFPVVQDTTNILLVVDPFES